MIVQEIKVSTIKAALESLKIEGVHNEALIDCLGFVNLPVSALEGFLDSNLWFADDADFDSAYPTEEGKAYAIALGSIEEHLVNQGLIYSE